MKRKHVFWAGVLLALIFILGTNLLSFQQSANDLYQAGILKKSGDGNLEEAIKLFQKIVDNFPDNRELASQALLQIGFCYDLLGEKKAEATFRKLIADYPDQKDTVQIAREKLALLTQKNTESSPSQGNLTLREVSMPYGFPSPDGRFILFYVGAGGTNLSLFDTKTEEKIPVTQYEPCNLCWCSGPTWSNDGEKIAFIKSSEQIDELHIVGAFDHKDKVIISDPEMGIFDIAGWSPDDKIIFVDIRHKDFSHSFGEIHIDSGEFNEIVKLGNIFPNNPKTSPDGRYFAYAQRNPDNAQWEIMITATDGGDTYPIIDYLSSSFFLGWTPDNKSILFSSSRAGNESIWMQEIFNGRPVGEPERIQNISGYIEPYGFTRSGAFYFSETHIGGDVYTAQIDLESGKTLKTPDRVEKIIQGHTSTPFWSPDGKYLGYLSRQFQGQNPDTYNILRIRSTETGKEKDFLLDFRPSIFAQLPKWSPDGKHIYLTGSYKEKYGIIQLDIQSGESRLFLEQKNLVAFSSDTSIIFFTKIIGTTKLTDRQSMIFRRNMDNEAKEIISSGLGAGFTGISLSTDKKWINFRKSYFRENESFFDYFIMPSNGGKLLDLSPVIKNDFRIRHLFWGPKDKGLLYTQMPSTDYERLNAELWYIPQIKEKLESRKLDLKMSDISHLSFHPDGQTIAFTSGRSQEEKFWVLENYLPPKKK